MPDRLTDAQWAALRKSFTAMADSRPQSLVPLNSAAMAGYLLMLMDRIDGLEEQLREGRK